MVTAAQICLLLATNAVCLLVGWLVARRFTSDGPAVAAGSWASNGISDSSSGNLFGIVKVRSYRGPRLYAEWRADARAPAPGAAVRRRASLQELGCDHLDIRSHCHGAPACGAPALVPGGGWRQEWAQGARVQRPGRDLPHARRPGEAALAVARHLRWNHFGRKNVGFLYAIAHGAWWVYDTDDDNELQRPHSAMPIPQPRPGAMLDEVVTNHALANLYPQASHAGWGQSEGPGQG